MIGAAITHIKTKMAVTQIIELQPLRRIINSMIFSPANPRRDRELRLRGAGRFMRGGLGERESGMAALAAAMPVKESPAYFSETA
jgi:hypothetical protein